MLSLSVMFPGWLSVCPYGMYSYVCMYVCMYLLNVRIKLQTSLYFAVESPINPFLVSCATLKKEATSQSGGARKGELMRKGEGEWESKKPFCEKWEIGSRYNNFFLPSC